MIDEKPLKEYLCKEMERISMEYRSGYDSPYQQGKLAAYHLTLEFIDENEKESQCQNS
jgi:hypothetical protein